MATFKIVRFYRDSRYAPRTIERGLTLAEAKEWCSDPETSSSTATGAKARRITARKGEWFEGYREEDGR